jgi:hypothetical protein
VLKFFPPEDIVSFTTLSEKALFWFEEDFPHKILSMGEACGVDEAKLQDYLLRELMSEGVIKYCAPQLLDGKVQTIEIVKHGPVCFMVTTTRAALHAENETRMLSLEVDDTPEQTKRVLSKTADILGLNTAPTEAEYRLWIDYQTFLRVLGKKRGGWKVVVPFAKTLAKLIEAKSVRLRRDFSQLLIAIKVNALLHVYRRKTNEKGEIIADVMLDYGTVLPLLDPVIGEASGVAVEDAMRKTVEAVRLATVGMTEFEGATSDQIATRFSPKLDQSTAHRRLQKACLKGYVVNLETRHRQPGRYRLTDKEMGSGSLLPTVEEVLAFEVPPPSPKSGAYAHTEPKSKAHQKNNVCTGVGEPNADANGGVGSDIRQHIGDAYAKQRKNKEKSDPYARMHEKSERGAEPEDGDAFEDLKDEKWRLR